MKDLYLKGMVHGFVETGGPVVGRSISIRLVLTKSVGDLEIISANLLVSILLSFCCMSNGTFASCSWIGDLLLSCACIVKLEWLGKAGSRGSKGWVLTLALTCGHSGEYMCCTFSTLFTSVVEPKIVFLGSLTTEIIMFSNGISISWGCLCSILCKTSKGIKPLGNCLSKLISNTLFTCIFLGVLMEIQVIDLPCNVHWPFDFTNCFGNCVVILKARNLFLMVRKCLPYLFHGQPIL